MQRNQGVECSPKFGVRVLKSKNSPDKSGSDSFDFLTSSPSKFLTAVHPSPLSASRGFFGCNHFAKVNEILVSEGKVPINWQIS